MTWLATHLRNKFTAGLFAVIPVAVVAYALYFVESNTRHIAKLTGFDFPGVGVLIVVGGVYLLGLAVTSVTGSLFLQVFNWLMERVPGANVVYRAWKDVLVVPPNKMGMFSHVVLVNLGEQRAQVGFTSGDPLPGDPNCICVLLPHIPNPFSGRILVVRKDACIPLQLSVQEAMKFQLSTGNYLPPGLSGPEVGRAAS